ncbi:hypothetical protein SAMN06297129_2978 [Pseudooceanicola antarcticus]|uniref:Uncharacterized protein n=1 Tax=Pseudooceanicola antarcticus TaxID=1247613 RepID=A0A285J4X3_9RHOB|nr:hypothetical protein [Pseudooceanicola antarcticus]PJE26808.1 hypothetical protein CVM39_15840 [Pseudooceanicola antarcticus]SNY55324.1 hypothetical protein SAMN06297129_2978 [Pseudooceanicola antarcticus]
MYVAREFSPDLDQVQSSIVEDEAPAWDAGTSYALNDRVIRGHRIYQSVIADNLGIDPTLEDQSALAARWVFDRFTNAFSAFDGILSNPTVASDDPGASVPWLDPGLGIDPATTPVILDIPGISWVDTLILFGVVATSARVICYDVADAVLRDTETNLSGRQVSNWWEWFAEPFEGFQDKLVDLSVPGTTARILIALSGAEVSLGEVFLGDQLFVGDGMAQRTEGRSVGGTRYSFNDYGSLTLAKGPTRIEMDYAVVASHALWKQVKPQLDRLSGSLVATIGSELRPSSIHFGILGPVRWLEDLPDEYEYSFTIMGIA